MGDPQFACQRFGGERPCWADEHAPADPLALRLWRAFPAFARQWRTSALDGAPVLDVMAAADLAAAHGVPRAVALVLLPYFEMGWRDALAEQSEKGDSGGGHP